MSQILNQDTLDRIREVARAARDARRPGTSLTHEFMRFVDEVTPAMAIELADEIEWLRGQVDAIAGEEGLAEQYRELVREHARLEAQMAQASDVNATTGSDPSALLPDTATSQSKFEGAGR